MVDTHYAYQRKLQARSGFQLSYMEEKCRVTGQQHHRPLAALGDRGTDRIGQPRAEVAEVLVPDDVARLGLRVRPLENDGCPTVAHHDAVLEFVERLGGLNDVACRMDRRTSRWRTFGKLREFRGIGLDQLLEVARRGARRVPQRLDELRHDTAQVADQWHVELAVDADGGRVLLDVDPFAVGIVACPMLGPAVVHGLPEFGSQRDAQVGFLDRLVGGRGEQVGECPVLQTLDVRRTPGGLDDRAGHQVGELLHRSTGARGVHAVAYQQDWALRFADQLRGL